jgi:hypothetical protein
LGTTELSLTEFQKVPWSLSVGTESITHRAKVWKILETCELLLKWQILACEAIDIKIDPKSKLFGLNQDYEIPELNDTEKEIIQTLSIKKPLTGEQISKETNIPYDSNLKQHLANLKRRGILGNSRNKPNGYFIESAYQSLAERLFPKS